MKLQDLQYNLPKPGTIERWLEDHKIDGYEIVDGLINVKGNVYLGNTTWSQDGKTVTTRTHPAIKEHGSLHNLGIRFGHVTGNFTCDSVGLSSLEGCPTHVGGTFKCSYNNIKSLEGGPKIVEGNYDCSRNNNLTSFNGCAQRIDGALIAGFSSVTSTEGICPNIGRGMDLGSTKISSFHNVHKHVKSVGKNVNGGVILSVPHTSSMLGFFVIEGILGLNLLTGPYVPLPNQRVNVYDYSKNFSSFVSKIFQQKDRDILAIQDAMIDAGFIKEAKL